MYEKKLKERWDDLMFDSARKVHPKVVTPSKHKTLP
jgi:hypothetical protein